MYILLHKHFSEWILKAINSPLVANAVKLFVNLLKGNLVFCIQHILVPLLTEVFLMVKKTKKIDNIYHVHLLIEAICKIVHIDSLSAVRQTPCRIDSCWQWLSTKNNKVSNEIRTRIKSFCGVMGDLSSKCGTHHVLYEVRGHSSLSLKVAFVVVLNHGCTGEGQVNRRREGGRERGRERERERLWVTVPLLKIQLDNNNLAWALPNF